MVRRWARKWVNSRELPVSFRGCHGKTFSLYDNPAIRDELRSFVRSNKWAVNPEKLVEFSKAKMVPTAAAHYLEHITNFEIPEGLKKYMELELFPRIQLKSSKGISLATARRLLRREGFQFQKYKKSLYYDGHERPDVVADRQQRFLPEMAKYEEYLVEYIIGDVEHELWKMPNNFVERRLVLCAHDEMTAQANDDVGKGWIFDGAQPLWKKGAGRGLHQSDVICSTVGWLQEASHTLEYGKNYEGYWTGELFVKQVLVSLSSWSDSASSQYWQLKEKIIPAFERVHGAGFRMLLMVDNSQGHSAYAKDALLMSRMNMNPGGKQAHLWDGWFMHHGNKITQHMIFPQDHPEFPGMPKGMKYVLIGRGLWQDGLRVRCKDCTSNHCCAKQVLDHQPDFQAQKSLVEEVVESAGHRCIFLPKFHCELNFIEYFWGATKRYLRNNCNYTFSTLQANMPKALASVEVHTIRKWEHRMKRWMEHCKHFSMFYDKTL